MNLTIEYLVGLEPSYIKQGYPVPKWIQFSKTLLNDGWTIRLHRAKTTFSKYLYINKGELSLKIRFSNHKANRGAEDRNDSDYYVGVGNKGVITTEQLIIQIKELETQISN
jgi:hypothetical protein